MHRTLRATAAAGILASAVLACSSSSSSPSSSGSTSGAALGTSCQTDTDCASNSRGTVACFIGGGGDGGGGGEAGADSGTSGSKSWCAFKCTPENQAQLCGPPFDGTCNARGYCRLN